MAGRAKIALGQRFRVDRWAVLCIALWFLMAPKIAAACPNCKGAVETSSDQLALGYALSIGFMLAVPLTIIGIWAVALWLAVRRLQQPVLVAGD